MSDTPSPLRAARDAEGFSREMVTRRLDPPVTTKTLERWERGDTPTPYWRLRQLATIYGVPVDSLESGVAA